MSINAIIGIIGITIAGIIVTAVLVGMAAQMERGRTGAIWFLLALILEGGAWFLATAVSHAGLRADAELVAANSTEQLEQAGFYMGGIAAGVMFLVMAIVVATLPRKKV